MKAWMALIGGMLAAGAAGAAEPALTVFHGEHDNYDRTGLSLRLGPLWERDWGAWRAGVHPEIELSRFRHDGPGPGPSTMDEGGAIGLLRVVRAQGLLQPYAELGLGGALLSRTSLGNKQFSTAFQFSEHLGLGLQVGGRFSAGWRFSHYSNAGIEKPNNGLDVHQVVVGMRF